MKQLRLRLFIGSATRQLNVVALARELSALLKGAVVEVLPNLGYQDYMALLEEGDLGIDAFHFGGCNTMALRPINNFDIQMKKEFKFTESLKFQIAAQAFNLLNHPQFVPGSINSVYPQDTHAQTGRNFLIPGTRIFNDFSQAYSNNPRNILLSARILF